MTAKTGRDQRPYELVQQHLPILIITAIIKAIDELGEPYGVKAGLGGVTAYLPKAMEAVCILLEAERKTYRKMAACMTSNEELRKK